MANKIGIVLALDGEKEFTAAVQTAKKEVNLFQSDLKTLSEKFDGQANSMAALAEKQKVLTQQQEAYQRKLDAAKSGCEKANENYRKMGDRLDDLKKDLENARKELQKMDEGTDEYKKQAKAVEELEKAVEKQTIAHTREAGSIAEWNQRVRESQRELDKSNDEIEKNARYLDEARNSADHCATSIDKMGREVKEAAKDVDKIGDEAKDTAEDLSEAGKTASVFGGVLAGNLASNAIEKGLNLAAKAGEALKDSMYDLSGASANLAAKTGLSEEAMRKYKDVMTEIKGDNFGEDYGDIADVMAEIVQIMGEMDPSAMKDATESAITLRDTFDMDVNESIRAVDVMMKTMGVDSKTAFDLIAKGAQNGLDRSHELTDNITEYGQLWGQMGFSAQEMFSILENGLDSGAYNLDKVNDYVKEFGVSLADGRIEKNIDKFSDGTKGLFEQWKDGEASARDVFYSVINDLSEMTDQQEALTIASDTWSALGEDNAMQVITALDDVNTAYSNVQGTMDKLKETKYSDLESAVSQLGASVQENVLTPIAEKALPLITGGVKLATEAIEGVGELINPTKTDFETFLDDIGTANEELETALANADTAKQNALAEGEKIGYLGERLIALNDIEDKSAAQRLEMDAIVQQLGEHIPQVADAYDAESGKVRLADDEIRNLITSTKELMVAQALQAQSQEVINKLIEAQIQYDKASDSYKKIFDTRVALRDLAKEYEDMAEKLDKGLTSEDDFAEFESEFRERVESMKGVLDETLGEDAPSIDSIPYIDAYLIAVYDALGEHQEDLSESMSETEQIMSENKETLDEYAEAGEHVVDSLGGTGDAAEDAAGKVGNLSEAMGRGMPTDVAEKMSGALQETADAAGEAADALEKEGDAAETVAEKVKTGAETQKEAIQGVLDTYHGYVDEIESDLQSKVSLFDKFDGGTDMTAEDMQTNMQSYVDGIRKYQENLAYVKEQMGEDLSPEFLQYIEDMGLDAANLLEHYATTIRKHGEEGKQIIKDTNDDYMEYLDLTGPIAEAQAANKTAMDAYTGALGSSEIDFTSLKDSIETAKTEAAGAWDGLSEATESALDDAVQTAQACGVKIPEGLADGISSGDISPEQAVEQLNGALQGSLEGLVQVAKDVGLGIPDDVADAIESGDPSKLAAAYDNMISHITDSADPEALKQSADQMTETYTSEVEDGADAAGSAGESLAQAAADAASEKQSEFKAAGDDSATTYAAAIRAHQQEAAQAAAALASAAQNAIASYRNAFENAGYNMSAGVASGISNGASSAINAARNMAAQTLAAAKAELDIHSPSKKFRKQVGQNISESTAFGIKDKASLAGSEATKMSAQVYSKATAWLSKYKKSHKVSLEDEKYYWQQVAEHTQKGTEAYNKAISKMLTASVSKKTGTGKNKKTKDVETYYSEIYNAANKYLSNQKILNDWSLQQELSYWTAVRAQLKSGTQAWYDATAQIKDLQADIAEAQREAAETAKEAEENRIQTLKNVHSKMLSQYKTYFQVSKKAEMDYWDIARQQFTEGTDARIEADQAYFDAKTEYEEKLLELKEEEAEKEQKINDDLADSIKDLQDAYDDAVKSREKEIRSSMNLFEAWDAEGWDSDKLMANLKTQVEGLQFWEDQLDELSKKGVTQELLDELAAMGPDAAANLWSLNQMTEEQLDEYQKLWQDKNNLAHKQALEDNKNLLKETEDSIAEATKIADEEITKLQEDYRKSVDELETGLSDGLKSLVTQAQNVGEEVVSTLVDAVRRGMTDVTALVTQAKQQATAQQAPQQQQPDAQAAARQQAAAAEAAARAAQTEKNTLLDIIMAGKSRSKTLKKSEKDNSDLWKYIVQHYGRKPYDGITNKLGAVLGISVSKKPTDKQKTAVLNALKKRGLATGARNIWQDELAWMLENAKTEYVVRTSDNAILQPMRAGDKVINPRGAENLYDFAADPTKFISTRARDALAAAQEAMQKRQDEMRSQIPELSYGGITRLNRLMESGMQAAPVVNVDNKELVSMMQQMVSGMQAIMGQMQDLQDRQIVMDSGALVGALQQPMSRANAAVQRRRNRGTLR